MKKYLPKFSSNKVFYLVLAFCIAVVCIPVVYAANDYRLKKRYEGGLRVIQIGDSKQSVISLMGEPDSREWCYPLPTSNDTAEQKRFHEKCVDQFRYAIFLQAYTVSFDKNGQVSWKGYSVSP